MTTHAQPPDHNPPAPQLSHTPYNFLPGEMTLIAYAAVRFDAAARFHTDFIRAGASIDDGDLLAEYHAQRCLTAWRRSIHFAWYTVDLEDGMLNSTRAKIDRDRAELFAGTGTYGELLTAALGVLGLRYMTANHLDPERW